MFTQVNEKCKPATANLFVYVADADEVYQMALDNGATSLMTPADQEYGRSGGVLDAFGNEWWMTTVTEEK
jgi:uncharacterized glyoxalase superfamily protein PhnB